MKKVETSTESSSDEDNCPSVAQLRSFKHLQKAVDKRIAKLEEPVHPKGNETQLKSKWGGAVDVVIKQKLAWSQEAMLRGTNKQRLFVQIFTRNILEEQNDQIRESMLSYLSDLMEDATDFTWCNAKAAHPIL